MATTAPTQAELPAKAAPAISGHQNALDGVRAVAAFAVLLLHTGAQSGLMNNTEPLAWLISRGDVGVPLFFALSGLLLYRPWAFTALSDRPPPGTGIYLTKRALRVLPAYWVVVAYVMFQYADNHLTDVWTWFQLLSLTYIYDPSPWWGNHLGPHGLGQMWSLTAELAFYVTLPLVGWVLTRVARRGADLNARARRLLYGIAVYGSISFVYTIFIFYPSDRPQWGLWLPRNLTWFAVGMALAAITVWARLEPDDDGPVQRFCRTVAASWGTCWICAGLLYCIASTQITGPLGFSSVDVLWTSEIRLAAYALISLFVIAPVAFASPGVGQPVYTILGNRVMRWLGKISYSVFLWQIAVLVGWYDLTNQNFGTGNFFVTFSVTVTATIVLSYLTYRLVEEPSRGLLRVTKR